MNTTPSQDQEILRQCVACRQYHDRKLMFRIVHDRQGPQMNVFGPENPKRVVSGRSAYLCTTEACLKIALKGKKIQKALKTFVPDAILGYLSNSIEGHDDGEHPD